MGFFVAEGVRFLGGRTLGLQIATAARVVGVDLLQVRFAEIDASVEGLDEGGFVKFVSGGGRDGSFSVSHFVHFEVFGEDIFRIPNLIPGVLAFLFLAALFLLRGLFLGLLWLAGADFLVLHEEN